MQAQTQKSILQSVFQVLQTNGIAIIIGNTLEDLLNYARKLLFDNDFWINLPNKLELRGALISKYTVRKEIEIAVEGIDADD